MKEEERQKKKFIKLSEFQEDKDLAMFEEMQEMNDNLEVIASKEMPKMEMPDTHKVEILGAEKIIIKGEPGDTPTDEHLIELIRPLIPKVADGKTPTEKELLALIRPLIPKVKDGETPSDERLLSLLRPLIPEVQDGYTPIKGKDYFDGKDGSPDTPEQIREKLASLEGEDRLDKSAIKGLEELQKEVTSLSKRPMGGGITGRDLFKDYDLSGQLDGVTKTFNIPAVWNIISVSLSSFPHALRKTVDFTYTQTTITFTSQIDAATSLATGQTCVLTIISA